MRIVRARYSIKTHQVLLELFHPRRLRRSMLLAPPMAYALTVRDQALQFLLILLNFRMPTA